MTVERKIVVGLEDLTNLVFECKVCKTRVTVSPDDARVPERCPNPTCAEMWVKKPTSSIQVSVLATESFVKAVGKLRAQSSDDWPKFRVLLEFDEPELSGR